MQDISSQARTRAAIWGFLFLLFSAAYIPIVFIFWGNIRRYIDFHYEMALNNWWRRTLWLYIAFAFLSALLGFLQLYLRAAPKVDSESLEDKSKGTLTKTKRYEDFRSNLIFIAFVVQVAFFSGAITMFGALDGFIASLYHMGRLGLYSILLFLLYTHAIVAIEPPKIKTRKTENTRSTTIQRKLN